MTKSILGLLSVTFLLLMSCSKNQLAAGIGTRGSDQLTGAWTNQDGGMRFTKDGDFILSGKGEVETGVFEWKRDDKIVIVKKRDGTQRQEFRASFPSHNELLWEDGGYAILMKRAAD